MEATGGVGQVMVATTNHQGHPPEFYAERITTRLVSVADTAPPEIRAQAYAYQEQVRAIVLNGVKGAILSSHTTVIAQLERAGMNEAAELVRKLRD